MARPPGLPNKNKRFLLDRLQAIYGDEFHPIMKMAENANRAQNLIDDYDEDPDADPQALFAGLKFAVDAWDKIAQYTEPKLKAIDHTGQIDSTVTVNRKEYKPSQS